ncbi:MAG TPA: sugar phosphate nucleotidyltransferase [Verrucomicrobiae bacterium]|jgi:mannose-1-phosphate guanylyltransferase|nr:sugar phosphate nucleotidyltransferase [Verrucomicrobiae bacterium]
MFIAEKFKEYRRQGMENGGLHSAEKCGIVLAAGDGKRLQEFVHRIRGDALPKQYVNLVGQHSLLENTFARVEQLIHPRRLFTVINGDHLKHPEVRRQLADREPETVIVQPANKETAPGILLPLAHIYHRHGDAVVAVFPSDHFVGDDALFMAHIDLACRLIEHSPRQLILLGIEPRDPETEYGYILPGRPIQASQLPAARSVIGFEEKPATAAARAMIAAGGLWNTMVMVFRAQTLIDSVRHVSPKLHRFFEKVRRAIGTADEQSMVKETYGDLEPMNFSTTLLEPMARHDAARLLVLPVRNVMWSDWGSEQRIASTLQKIAPTRSAARQPRTRPSPALSIS